MKAVELLHQSLGTSRKMLEWMISDLSDDDLRTRPVPEANHFAWQLGHLIAAEKNILLEQLPQAAMPTLPDGFEELHSREAAGSVAEGRYLSRDQYLSLFGQVREATIAALSGLSDADLNRPAVGNLASFFPNLGAVLGLLSDHIYLHLGQATVLRRKLGKPVLF